MKEKKNTFAFTASAFTAIVAPVWAKVESNNTVVSLWFLKNPDVALYFQFLLITLHRKKSLFSKDPKQLALDCCTINDDQFSPYIFTALNFYVYSPTQKKCFTFLTSDTFAGSYWNEWQVCDCNAGKSGVDQQTD